MQYVNEYKDELMSSFRDNFRALARSLTADVNFLLRLWMASSSFCVRIAFLNSRLR